MKTGADSGEGILTASASAATTVGLSSPWSSLVGFRARWTDYVELCKPRISALVLAVTAIGFAMGSPAALDIVRLLHTLVGVALVAVGANTLNQVMEREFDRRMVRTRNRPVPAGRIGVRHATAFGAAASLCGLLQLALLVNLPAFLAASATIGLYLAVYTPLKRRTVWNTMVGAVPGALPPVIGYVAASGTIGAAAWMLFSIVFVWQLPHFFAIAWIYREDYARGGYRMLSVADPTGRRTVRSVVLWSLVLLAVSLVPWATATLGGEYAVAAGGLGLAFLAAGLWMAITRSIGAARLVVLASIAYLPAVMILALMCQR